MVVGRWSTGTTDFEYLKAFFVKIVQFVCIWQLMVKLLVPLEKDSVFYWEYQSMTLPKTLNICEYFFFLNINLEWEK